MKKTSINALSFAGLFLVVAILIGAYFYANSGRGVSTRHKHLSDAYGLLLSLAQEEMLNPGAIVRYKDSSDTRVRMSSNVLRVRVLNSHSAVAAVSREGAVDQELLMSITPIQEMQDWRDLVSLAEQEGVWLFLLVTRQEPEKFVILESASPIISEKNLKEFLGNTQ